MKSHTEYLTFRTKQHREYINIPVTDGKLDFGPWQQVYYAEFDGQRSKRVIIKVMGE